VRDRKFHLQTYHDCFVGSEVVDYLIDHELAPSRSAAVGIGRELMNSLGAFEHVAKDHDFKDEYLFYRFIKEEEDGEEEKKVDEEGQQQQEQEGGGDEEETPVPNYSQLAKRGSSGGSGGGIIKMDKYGFLLEDDRALKHDEDDDDYASSQHSNDHNGHNHSSSNLSARLRSRYTDARRWQNILDKVPSSSSSHNNTHKDNHNHKDNTTTHHSSKSLNNHSSPNISYATTQSKVKYYARRGLPDSLRRKAWTLLTGVDLIMEENSGEYDALVAKADEEYRKMHDLDSAADLSESFGDYVGVNGGGGGGRGEGADGGGAGGSPGTDIPPNNKPLGTILETIERDIHRTFPKHYLFKSVHPDNEDEGSSHASAVSSLYADSENTASDNDSDDDNSVGPEGRNNDEIATLAETTGQEVAVVVETKKKLFNDSLYEMMNSTPIEGGGLLGDSEHGMEEGDVHHDDDDDDDDDHYHHSTNYSKKNSQDSHGSMKSFDIFGEMGEEEEDHFTAETAGVGASERSGSRGEGSSYRSQEALGMGHGQAALRRVLRAYCIYDSEVGYCQGMNFITAMFLTFLTEEESFWLLVVVMNEEPYKLRELFGEDMAGTHEVLYIAEKLLSQFLPKLSKHMEAQGIHVSMFVTQWLMTVYTSTFPFDLVARVWDSFLVEGWKVVYRVMLSLLEFAMKDVLEMQFEQILHYFREFPATVNGQMIIHSSLKIALKRKHIQKHVNEWRRHAGSGEETKKVGRGIKKFRRRPTDENSSVSSSTMHSDSAFSKINVKPGNLLKRAPKEIVVEDLSEQLLPILGRKHFAVMLHNVLTSDECSELIDRAEEHGFEDASIYDRRTNKSHRNCKRFVIDDSNLAENWYDRIITALKGTKLEQKLNTAPWIFTNNRDKVHTAVSLNERLRLLKYKQGQFFHSHNDAVFVRGPDEGARTGERSALSVHVYLNQKFKGGSTTFRGKGRHLDIKPKTGSILIFEHNILHEGQKVTHGKKYVVRTDIMYSSANVGFTSAASGTTLTQQL